jgi:hypothetical protein
MGGRRNKSPMASIGGTQGAEVLKVSEIQAQAAAALNLIATSKKQSTKNDSEATDILNGLLETPPLNFAGDMTTLTLNFKDSLAADSDTPRQFQKGRQADCRVFYSSDDVLRVDSTWERIGRGDYECADNGKKAWEQGSIVPDKKMSGGAAWGVNWTFIGVFMVAIFI